MSYHKSSEKELASSRSYRNFGFTILSSFFLSSLLSVSSPLDIHAETVTTDEWNISADKVTHFDEPNSIVAKGNVILEKKEKLPKTPPKKKSLFTSWATLLEEDQPEEEVLAEDVEVEATEQYKTTVTIQADWMVYDVELESIKAKGNLKVITDEDQLLAKEGTLNLATETGKFKEATIIREEHSLHLEGDTIEKTGFDTYKIIDGWAITCKIDKDETPPWSFVSASTDMRQGGYAVLKHARFQIRNVPVLYTPYLILPVKNTRQTGFLFPEIFSSTNGGFGFDVPFFLNISDSADITFFPEYYSNRGFMPGAELRYVASESNKGAFTASFLDDQLSDPSETEYYADTGYTHDNSDRYWIRGKADYNFGENWQSRVDIDIVSDQDYLREFNSGTTGFENSHDRYLDTFGRGFENDTDTQRENSLKILRSWSGISLEGEFLGINDASTLASDTDTPLWKLPSVDFTGTLPAGFRDVTFDWEADYVNYWREDGIGGNRFDINPSLSTPLPLGPYLESRAEIGVRDTLYFVQTFGEGVWEEDSTQNRIYPEFEADIATTLERDFFAQSDTYSTLRHQFRPFVEYGYIPDVDQDDLPQFDSVDTISEKNAITYGMDNFFNQIATEDNGLESLSDYATLKIEQSYSFVDTTTDETTTDEPFSDIYGKLKWQPLKKTSVEYKTYYDVYDNKFNSHNFEGIFRSSRGDYLGLEYSFKDADEIEQINGFLGTTIFDRWLIKGEVEHSISQEETVKANGSLTYQALCWSVKFETKYTPEDTTYMVVFNLANIGIPFGASI
ncbi:MAG: LPS-assembly protein LptD [Desulfobulbaceae bacterium]|nr:LPS-assembly protein LptD [Desulfobulbaceae bacterium]